MYSELSQSSENIYPTKEVCPKTSTKIFNFAEDIYSFQKNIKACNKVASKLSDYEKSFLVNCQDYVNGTFADTVLEALLNIVHFKYKIKNVLDQMRLHCNKNYELRLTEVKDKARANTVRSNTEKKDKPVLGLDYGDARGVRVFFFKSE